MINTIVDFLCYEKKLIVELDDGQHNQDDDIVKDQKRDGYLRKNGFRILRFWNNEVKDNLNGVLMKIKEELESLSP